MLHFHHMKLQRWSLVSLLLCVALLGVGCSSTETATPAGSGAPASATGSVATDARGCAHPYFPLRAGYSAKYSTIGNAGATAADDAYTLEVTDVGDHQATLAMTFENSQLRSTQVVRCAAGDITESSYASVFPDPASGNGFSAETLSAEGVLLPANVRVGDTWTQKFTIVMHPQGELAQAFRDVRATVTIAHRAAGEETVVTPAGAYQALRVESSTDMQFQGAMANMPIPEGDTSAILSKTWYARGVGIVRQQTDEASATTVLEEVRGNR